MRCGFLPAVTLIAGCLFLFEKSVDAALTIIGGNLNASASAYDVSETVPNTPFTAPSSFVGASAQSKTYSYVSASASTTITQSGDSIHITGSDSVNMQLTPSATAGAGGSLTISENTTEYFLATISGKGGFLGANSLFATLLGSNNATIFSATASVGAGGGGTSAPQTFLLGPGSYTFNWRVNGRARCRNRWERQFHLRPRTHNTGAHWIAMASDIPPDYPPQVSANVRETGTTRLSLLFLVLRTFESNSS